MEEKNIQFSLRLPKKLHDRMMSVIAATENEVTRTGLIILALEAFAAQLEVIPAMLPNYDPTRDKSARQFKQTRSRKCGRDTGGNNE